MKKKAKFLNGVLIAVSFIFLAACSSDDKENEEPVLAINPVGNALAFSAEAIEKHEIEVITNQAIWDAVSDKDWCKVEKASNKFTVTALPNTSPSAPERATIRVTAGAASPILISVTQSGKDVVFSISPEGPFNFSAAGTETYEVTVTTNQDNWNAVSNATWCTLTRNDNTFTIKADLNPTAERLESTITVSADNAADITIIITQDAGEEPVEDDGLTIWDDNHLRWFKLKGKVKRLEEPRYMAEFNESGKVTNFSDGSDKYEFKYDSQGRISEMIVHQSDGIFTYKYEYGNHTKYLPVFIRMGDMDEDYLVRGVTSVIGTSEEDDIRIVYNISGSTITGSGGGMSLEIEYSGDFPVTYNQRINEGYARTIKKTYKYGKNYKYSEMTEYMKADDASTPDIDEKRQYIVDNTIYCLPETITNGGTDRVIKYEYDSRGREIKYTYFQNDVTYYSYEDDEHGNWITRISNSGISGSVGSAMDRKITYY